jgi:branched-chain amino acid transport system permease protein
VIEDVAAGEISSVYRQLFVYGTLLVYLLGKDLFGENGIATRVRQSKVSRRMRGKVAGRVLDAKRLTMPDHAGLAGLSSSSRWRMLFPVILLVVLAIMPLFLTVGGEAMSSLMVIMLSAIVGTGLVMVMGLGGMFSLGQSGFVLIGGYTVAILTVKHGWNPWAAVAAGTLLATLASLVIGWLTLRLQGFNLAIATLAISLMLVVFVSQDTSFTGGVRGVDGVPALKLFGLSTENERDFFWLLFVALAVCLLLARNLGRSRIGRSLRAVSVDEQGAETLGVNAFRLKLLVFVIGGAMAGLAGAFWVFYLQLAAPENWAFPLTISLVTYVVVGGLTSVYGGLVGAIVVGTLQYFVTQQTAGLGESSSEYEVLLNGAFLIFFLLVFRQGIAVALSLDRVKGYVERLRGVRGGG